MTWRDKIEAQMAAKRDVFVAVPTTTGRVTVGIAHFLNTLERLSLVADYPWRFQWQVVNGRRPVEFARNVLCGIFLEKTKAEKLWFIDEDMVPTESSLQLLDLDADIVAGRAWAFDHSAPEAGKEPSLRLCLFHYNRNGDFKFNPIVPKDGDSVLPIVAAGTATMLISRKVIEDRRLWLSDEYQGLDGNTHRCSDDRGDDWAPPIFRTQYAPNGRILRGEDLDFCLRAHELDYRVLADVTAQFGHLKELNIDDVAMLCELVARRVAANSTQSSLKDIATIASFAHEKETYRYAEENSLA